MAFDKTRFGGVVAPIVNPCGEDDSLDRGALEANLTRLLATDVARAVHQRRHGRRGQSDARTSGWKRRRFWCRACLPRASWPLCM